MEESTSRYWCHLCEQIVNPISEDDEDQIQCPFCQSGFVEAMASSASGAQPQTSLSLWAPILLGMTGRPRRRRRFRHADDGDSDEESGDLRRERERELDAMVGRSRTSSAAILQLLQGIRAGLASETENLESLAERERERVILVDPFDRTLLVQGQTENRNPVGSLGDYFAGPGLDLMLQHLTENDPNRYGTPPARKEAVDALPSVVVKGALQCPVCLDDFEAGAEAREMPCRHKFHGACIVPWLELHSSCPVCRFQLPSGDAKPDSDGNAQRQTGSESNARSVDREGEEEEGRNGSGGGRWFSLPWPFSGLFSSPSSPSSSSSSSNANGD